MFIAVPYTLNPAPSTCTRYAYHAHITPSTPTPTGSYLRLIDSCITQLKAQGPSRTCNESKEEEEEGPTCIIEGRAHKAASSPRPAAQTPTRVCENGSWVSTRWSHPTGFCRDDRYIHFRGTEEELLVTKISFSPIFRPD